MQIKWLGMKTVALPAVDGNGSVLAKLFFRLVHLPNKVNKAFAHLRNSLFRPVRELELAYRPRLAVLVTATVTSQAARLTSNYRTT